MSAPSRRLWAANADPDSYEFRSQSLSLLTPLRTLRGHQESVTSLQLVSGSTGVCSGGELGLAGATRRVQRLRAVAVRAGHWPGLRAAQHRHAARFAGQ